MEKPENVDYIMQNGTHTVSYKNDLVMDHKELHFETDRDKLIYIMLKLNWKHSTIANMFSLSERQIRRLAKKFKN